ncbi:MAG: Crp/Fnr family transcriptional regulator [Flavobacteriales bacterium]|jgi:CRP/FNR family transcriptional regulator
MKLEDKHRMFKIVVRMIDSELDDASLQYFTEGTFQRQLKRNELLVHTDRVHGEISFVAKGLLRGYYIDDKGNELNTRFVKEGGFVTHYKAFICQEPSKYYFRAVEPCELLCFDHQHIQTAYRNFPRLERFGRLMAEAIIRKMDSRLESQQFDSAEKRYRDFMREDPDLHNRLSLEQIASYIRITRPALSRLRAKKS